MGRLSGLRTKREQVAELLSTYLDGELSAVEQARLEAQLEANPALQAELDALRQTVKLVRDLPQIPIPRNFILPQTMAARPRAAPATRARFAPLLTAATAIAGFLFVAVLSLDLLRPAGGDDLALAPAPPQMAAEVPPEITVEREVEPPPLAAEAPVEELEAAEGEELDGTPVEGKATIPGVSNGAPVAASPVADGSAATPAPLATTLADEDYWDAAPEATPEAAPPPTRGSEVESPGEEGGGVARPLTYRSLEVTLGLIASGLALVTAWAWRARRR